MTDFDDIGRNHSEKKLLLNLQSIEKRYYLNDANTDADADTDTDTDADAMCCSFRKKRKSKLRKCESLARVKEGCEKV